MSNALSYNNIDYDIFTNNQSSNVDLLNATVLYTKSLTLRDDFFENPFCIILICIFAIHLLMTSISTYIDGKVAYIPPVFRAFSLKRHWSALTQDEVEDNELRSIHGIK